MNGVATREGGGEHLQQQEANQGSDQHLRRAGDEFDKQGSDDILMVGAN